MCCFDYNMLSTLYLHTYIFKIIQTFQLSDSGGQLINFCLNCIKNCQEVLEDNFSSNYKSEGWPRPRSANWRRDTSNLASDNSFIMWTSRVNSPVRNWSFLKDNFCCHQDVWHAGYLVSAPHKHSSRSVSTIRFI